MDETRFGTQRHMFILGSVIAILMGILVMRLYELQFVEYDAFRAQAERNSIRRIAREPLRGLILDKDHNVLVANNPTYTLTVTPFEFKWENLGYLSQLFSVDSNLVRYRIMQAGVHSFEPVKIERDIPFAQIARLEEHRHLLPGVNYIIESRREYKINGTLSHLLGYTKEITPTLLRKLGPYYQPGDMVGHSGLEAFYENVLRGNKGYGFFTVNAKGKVIESFERGQSDIAAREGSDVVLTIDLQLQSFVERIMRNRRGAVVALDPNNGEVLAFVSSPSFDLKDMSGKISFDRWNQLRNDPGLPLFNRCSMAAYPPGSTFKMMLALAALQEGIIDESSRIHCPGYYTLAGVTFKCHGAHGDIGVVRSLEYSCNVFYYKLIFKLGFERWAKYGSLFQFGRKTGMDIANENPGTLPSEEYYNKRYGKRWNKGYLVSLGIGQGEVNTTPLQMAAYVAAIANGGTYYRPHAIRAIVDRSVTEDIPIPLDAKRLPFSSDVVRVVKTGMYRAVNGSGTGYAARISGGQSAGKTGTAQNPHGRDHAWFVGFAPYQKPTIALAVIVENGGYGGEAAAPVAGAIMRYYLYRNYLTPSVKDTTQTEVEIVETTPQVQLPD